MQARFDKNGNHIATTLFESYLSKFIAENTDFYREVFEKINLSIFKFIKNNEKNPQFDRQLFSLFSIFSVLHPEYTKIEDLLNSEINLQAHPEFHKLFFENVFLMGKPKPLDKENKLYSLSELAQFAISKHPILRGKLEKRLRPKILFSEINRSRIEIEDDISHLTTRKLGISDEEFTPLELLSFYRIPYHPAQLQFKRNYQGFFSRWLAKRELPFVAGPSGTLEVIFSSLIKLDTFTPLELKTYCMAAAATWVARGHHSFVEIFIVAQLIGFTLKDIPNRKEFYEQFFNSYSFD